LKKLQGGIPKKKNEEKMINVAINGFGRIGRNFLRAVLQDQNAQKKLNVVAINVGPACPENVAHMFKYDTVMGTFSGDVYAKNGILVVDGKEIAIIAELDPSKANWERFSVDWVVEACGKFTHKEGASKHFDGGAKAVLISAPAKGEDITIIPGVNDNAFEKEKHKIVSLGSCSTNAVVPMLKVLHDAFEVESGFLTTIHAYTNTQVLLDVECGKDLRRSRAAALNMIPTTTGATKVLGKILPELDGKIGGVSVRVPVANVSLADLAFVTKKELSVEKIKEVFSQAATGPQKGIVAVTDEPLVSSDFYGNPYSVVIDMPLVAAHGNTGKIFGWYDNEWGYSERLKDFLVTQA